MSLGETFKEKVITVVTIALALPLSTFFWAAFLLSKTYLMVLFMIWLAWILGISPWITIAIYVIPYIIVLYVVARRRALTYIETLRQTHTIKDIGRLIQEYKEMIEEQQGR